MSASERSSVHLGGATEERLWFAGGDVNPPT
jgi:hypothetical protein